VRKADNLPPSCAVVTKSGSLNFLEPSGPVKACNGTVLPLPLRSYNKLPKSFRFLVSTSVGYWGRSKFMKPFASSCLIPCAYRHRGPFPILYDLNCVQRRFSSLRLGKNIQILPGQTLEVSFHLLQLKRQNKPIKLYVSTQLCIHFVLAVRPISRFSKMTATTI